MEDPFDVLVVGAGAAGLGVGVALKHAGITNFQILDRGEVASSFRNWPQGMQLITPSFPANSIGVLDLNSIAIGTSPGYSLSVEHPSGRAYAAYLKSVADFFELPTRSNTEVYSLEAEDGLYALDTSSGTLQAKHVVWATGEFQFPYIPDFQGAELGIHNSRVTHWGEYAKSSSGAAVIIGGYESGIDAACQLAKHDCKSIVLSREATWESEDSDPSRSLSPYTQQRLSAIVENQMVKLHGDADIVRLEQQGRTYLIRATDGLFWKTRRRPVLATGFRGGFQQVVDRFELREDGFPVLNEFDESTLSPDLFLVGPSVRHEGLIFCFIFKYRQRFAIVAKAIAQRLGLETDELESTYRKWGMFLDDLSCCGEQCAC